MKQTITFNHAGYHPMKSVKVTEAHISSHQTGGENWTNLSLTIGEYPNQTTIDIRDDADMSAAWSLYEELGIAIQDARRMREERADAQNVATA